LDQNAIQQVFFKGIDPRIDSYSALFDNAHRRSTGMDEYLRKRSVSELYVMGLATDYCVKFTALDALHLGFRVRVITDGCRGVNAQTGDDERAFREMQEAGAALVTSQELAFVED
jgi:nicotinamidase/pyrazinamidase